MKMRNQSGSALVEFAIILPLLLVLVGGIVDFGVLYYDKQILTNASREGARAGIVHEVNEDGSKKVVSEAMVQDVVKQYCWPDWPGGRSRLLTFGGSSLPVTAAPGVNTLSYDDDLTVTVTFTYHFVLSSLLNIFGGEFGPTMDISGVTVMRME